MGSRTFSFLKSLHFSVEEIMKPSNCSGAEVMLSVCCFLVGGGDVVGEVCNLFFRLVLEKAKSLTSINRRIANALLCGGRKSSERACLFVVRS